MLLWTDLVYFVLLPGAYLYCALVSKLLPASG